MTRYKPQSVIERFIWARKTHGLTQKEMAKRLSVDPATLARWEKGEENHQTS